MFGCGLLLNALDLPVPRFDLFSCFGHLLLSLLNHPGLLLEQLLDLFAPSEEFPHVFVGLGEVGILHLQ